MINEQPKKKSALLPINQLRTFEGHPYKVLDNEEMDSLVKSIKGQGILSPLIVRPLENGEYEVISGHRRLRAAEKIGLTEVPALIYPLDRNEAILAVVDSNLHREHILPSEKAFAYKLKMEALSKQGKLCVLHRLWNCWYNAIIKGKHPHENQSTQQHFGGNLL